MMVPSHMFRNLFHSNASAMELVGDDENVLEVTTEVNLATEPEVEAMYNNWALTEWILVCAVIVGLWRGLDWITEKIFQRVEAQEDQI